MPLLEEFFFHSGGPCGRDKRQRVLHDRIAIARAVAAVKLSRAAISRRLETAKPLLAGVSLPLNDVTFFRGPDRDQVLDLSAQSALEGRGGEGQGKR